ncbi:hypothetical protein V6Z12_D06G169600 [Gossypium hirsutum]
MIPFIDSSVIHNISYTVLAVLAFTSAFLLLLVALVDIFIRGKYICAYVMNFGNFGMI